MTEQISIFKTPEGEAKTMTAYEGVLAHWPVPYQELDLLTSFGTTHIIVSGPAGGKPIIVPEQQTGAAAESAPV